MYGSVPYGTVPLISSIFNQKVPYHKYGSVEFVFVKNCGIFTVHKRTSHVKEIPLHKPKTGEFLELWDISNRMYE